MSSAPTPKQKGITFVTVVFDAELDLLELQGRSLRLYMDPAAVSQIIVINNGLTAFSPLTRRRLQRAYGPLWKVVRVMRTTDLVDAGHARGWRSQQAAKLAVSRKVATEHYVVLDAKNHLTRPTGVASFVAADGRAHGALHTYREHPLRPSLEHTLSYLGATPEQRRAAIDSFPPTATPFVFTTTLVRQMLDDVESQSSAPFDATFEREELLEFFLYSGWVMTYGPGLSAVIDGRSIPSPTVWPKAADARGVRATIAEAEDDNAFVFAVHRQVLARADAEARDLIAAHWVDAGLFAHQREARAFIRRFRRRYYPALIATRLGERVRRVF